jgi:diguanylate cyclase (GGDEF)-like protein
MFALFFFTLWLGNRDHVAGLGYWTINLVLQVVGKGIAISEIVQNDQFATSMGYLLSSMGAIFFYFGLAAFTHTAIHRKFYYILLAIMGIVIVWSVNFAANANIRSLVYALAVLFISIRYLSLLWKHRNLNPWFVRPFRLLLVLYSFLTLFYCLRIASDLTSLVKGDLLQTLDSPLLRISQFLTLGILIGVNFSILMLINNKLLSDLDKDSRDKDRVMGEFKVLAEHDGLTGIFNRGTMNKYLETELVQLEEPLRCMVNMVDIDNFKSINDTYGHETGDSVLIHLANIFSAMIREHDKVGRWGGDEFFFIVRNVSPEEAAKLIQRIHTAVATYDWATKLGAADLKVCISSGYAFGNGKESIRDILREVDLNLYTAKQNGRNQFVGG